MIDHEGTETIVCPYCGCEFQDNWEYPDEDWECSCQDCGKKFYYSRDVQVSYTSHKLKVDGTPDFLDELDEEE